MAYDLYVITDRQIARGLSHAEIARRAVSGGADAIQLRDKTLSSRALVQAASEIRSITRETGTCFIVNDRIDIALATGADGVHLGQEDLPVMSARRIAPPGFIIGVSIGTVAEAVSAVSAGADYIALSPTFDTGSKADAGPGYGLRTLRKICEMVSVPVIAIGGINPGNVAGVVAAGAAGIAVISAVVSAEDIAGAARYLKESIRDTKASIPERRSHVSCDHYSDCS
jgi:thiamine-phosphate pyrophosphorylase